MNNHNTSVYILNHLRLEDYFYSSISQIHQHVSEHVWAYVTGINSSLFNFLLVTQNDPSVVKALETGIQLMEERCEQPFSIVTAGGYEHIQKVSNQAGFVYDPESLLISMRLDLENWQIEDRFHSEYDIRCVNHCLADWTTPIDNAFNVGQNIASQYQKSHEAALLAGKQLQHYALYVDEKPVSAMTLSRVQDHARLDDLGTLVDMQGKGYATALMHHVLSESKRQGVKEWYLDGVPARCPSYARMGFKPLFEHYAFFRE
ncbi:MULTISPECIES: GNAT family N-acetyltransferase [Xenorhabdus]|uniref:Acetyltransferase (GNAT) family protein n=1 Tax=Xenorhabdus ehlersii TaxID=290111 RepID=A0A2D0IYN9_9GAMM|nr:MULTISPECIES: GNAT family N-acetyltransferase [Xenorhabdus]MBC8948612.1 GNAT family acetyltransferase [Xenorhabdus sp. TS4]PHM27079.1 GNAT family acetyltransferase [Xenorhabdus ehlersii]RKE92506.1 acetyltransferase (GNAT) family protein [Xenorhabdus ehlersii]